MRSIRFEIIGSGGIAHAHINEYKKLANVQIVGVADVVPGKTQQFIDTLSLTDAQAFEDHRKAMFKP